MKKIFLNRRRLALKDVVGWLAKITGHYFAFFTFSIIMLSLRYVFFSTNFYPSIGWKSALFIYCWTLAPFVNGLFHIIYFETGLLAPRALMWLYSFAHMILIFIILFSF